VYAVSYYPAATRHSVYVLVPFDSMLIKFAMVTHLGVGIFVTNLKKKL